MRAFRLLAIVVAGVASACSGGEDFSWIAKEGREQGLRVVPAMNMAPTLLVDDRIVVVDMDGQPERGDIVIFRHPKSQRDLVMVKRVVGLPGDSIEMRDGRLYLNDEMIPRKETRSLAYVDPDFAERLEKVTEYEERLPGAKRPHLIHEFSDRDMLDQTPRFVVPAGHYFMLGAVRFSLLRCDAVRAKQRGAECLSPSINKRL